MGEVRPGRHFQGGGNVSCYFMEGGVQEENWMEGLIPLLHCNVVGRAVLIGFGGSKLAVGQWVTK